MRPLPNIPFDLFLFAGQSNMAGRGITCSRFPETAPVVSPEAGAEFRAISDPTTLYPIAEPFGALENNPQGIYEPGMKTGSLVSSFVNTYYSKTGIPVLGISASKGGSSILEWLPGTPYFQDLCERYQKCLDYICTNDIKIHSQYLLWCQGETDGDHKMSKEKYVNCFAEFWNALKLHGIKQCYLIQIGHFNPYLVGPDAELHDYSEIMDAQRYLSKEFPDVTLVSDSFSSMLRRGLMKDAFHYYQKAYNEVGEEAAGNIAVLNGKLVNCFMPRSPGCI